MNKIQWVGSLALLFVIIIYAGVLINDDTLHPSESNSIRHTGFIQGDTYTLSETLESVQTYSPEHAPFYYVLLSTWSRFTAIHPLVLRILSLYFSLITASFLFRMGNYIDRDWGGLIALFLVTFSAYHMFYAHEIRNYGLLALTSVLVLWAYWRLILSPHQSHKIELLWLYAASVWALYVHYFGIFVLIGIGFYHLFFVDKNRLWWLVSLTEIFVGITFLPWLPIVLKGATSGSVDNITSGDLNLLEVFYQHLFVFGNGLPWLLTLLLILAIWKLWELRHQRNVTHYIFVIGLVMLVAMIFVNLAVPLLPVRRMRYTVVWLPQITLLMTIAIVALSRYRWLQILLLIVWVGSFFWFNTTPEILEYTNVSDLQSHKYPNYQVIVDNYDTLVGEGETIVSVNKDVWVLPLIIQYYEALTGYEILHVTDDVSQFERPNKMWQLQTNNLEGKRGNYSFWLLTNPQYTNLDDVTIFQLAIPDYSRPCLTYIDTETTYLAYYLRNDLPCELVNEPTPKLEYNNGVQLLNFVSEQKDDQLEFYTWWDNLPKEPYGFAVQLFDTNGNKVAQGDYFLPPATIQISKLGVSTLASGDYDVQIVLYDVETASSQSGIISAKGESFDRIVSVDRVVLNASSSD